MTPPDDRSERLGGLEVQVENLTTQLTEFRQETRERFDGLEKKVDANLEAGFKHDRVIEGRVLERQNDHERRLAEVEGRWREYDGGAHTTQLGSQRRLSSFQIVGITVGVIVGLSGLLMTFLALVATVLIAVLSH
jgi:hypothetical protein